MQQEPSNTGDESGMGVARAIRPHSTGLRRTRASNFLPLVTSRSISSSSTRGSAGCSPFAMALAPSLRGRLRRRRGTRASVSRCRGFRAESAQEGRGLRGRHPRKSRMRARLIRSAQLGLSDALLSPAGIRRAGRASPCVSTEAGSSEATGYVMLAERTGASWPKASTRGTVASTAVVIESAGVEV